MSNTELNNKTKELIGEENYHDLFDLFLPRTYPGLAAKEVRHIKYKCCQFWKCYRGQGIVPETIEFVHMITRYLIPARRISSTRHLAHAAGFFSTHHELRKALECKTKNTTS